MQLSPPLFGRRVASDPLWMKLTSSLVEIGFVMWDLAAVWFHSLDYPYQDHFGRSLLRSRSLLGGTSLVSHRSLAGPALPAVGRVRSF